MLDYNYIIYIRIDFNQSSIYSINRQYYSIVISINSIMVVVVKGGAMMACCHEYHVNNTGQWLL